MFAILKGIILPPFVLHDGSVCPRLSLEGPTFPGLLLLLPLLSALQLGTLALMIKSVEAELGFSAFK